MISILLYDDNRDLRTSMRLLLNESDRFIVLADFDDCLHVEEQVKEISPDVILMDIDMPGVSGIDAVKLIRKFNRKTFILMLTVFDDSHHVLDAI